MVAEGKGLPCRWMRCRKRVSDTCHVGFLCSFRAFLCCNMLAPPGGFARLGTMSTVTTCDEYPQPFVVLVVMVLILMCFSI